MTGTLGDRKVGDILKRIVNGRVYLVRIERVVSPTTVVLQEMDRDKLGRLRSIGEEGRFSTTGRWARTAPVYKRKAGRK